MNFRCPIHVTVESPCFPTHIQKTARKPIPFGISHRISTNTDSLYRKCPNVLFLLNAIVICYCLSSKRQKGPSSKGRGTAVPPFLTVENSSLHSMSISCVLPCNDGMFRQSLHPPQGSVWKLGSPFPFAFTPIFTNHRLSSVLRRVLFFFIAVHYDCI